jgi:hypothetical protein
MHQISRAMASTGQASGILKYLDLLMANGYVEIARTIPGSARAQYAYRLVKDTGAAVPCERANRTLYDPNLKGRCEVGRQRIWNLLRLANTPLSKEEMVVRAEVTESNLSNYLSVLARHGYLRVTGRRPKYYRLILNTGPYYPAWQDCKLFDQNTGEFIDEVKDED